MSESKAASLRKQFEAAIDFYTNVKYKLAFSLFLNLYGKDHDLDNDVRYYLGLCYFYGHGPEKNKKYGLELLTLAANNGSSEACGHLGLIYHLGEYVPQNKELALSFYNLGARTGKLINYFHLGMFHFTEKNFTEAEKCFQHIIKNAADDQDFNQKILEVVNKKLEEIHQGPTTGSKKKKKKKKSANAEEQAKKDAEESERKKIAAAAAEAKRKDEEEKQKKIAEDEAKRKADEERQKQIAEAQEQARKDAEESERKKIAAAAAEAKRKDEEEKQKKIAEDEAKRKADEEKQQQIAETKEQAKRDAEEEERKKTAAAAVEAKRKTEEEKEKKVTDIREFWNQPQQQDFKPAVETPLITIRVSIPLTRVETKETAEAFEILHGIKTEFEKLTTKYQILLVGGATRCFHSNIFFKTKIIPNDIDTVTSCDAQTIIRILRDLKIQASVDSHIPNLIRIRLPSPSCSMDILCIDDKNKIITGQKVLINMSGVAVECMCHVAAIFGKVNFKKNTFTLLGTSGAFSDLKLANTPYAKKTLTFCKDPSQIFAEDPFRMLKIAKIMIEYGIQDPSVEKVIRENAYRLKPRYLYLREEKNQEMKAKSDPDLESQRFSMLKTLFCTEINKRIKTFHQLVKLGIWDAFFPGSNPKNAEIFLQEIAVGTDEPTNLINTFLTKLVQDACDSTDLSIEKIIYKYNLRIWAGVHGLHLSSLSPSASEFKSSRT